MTSNLRRIVIFTDLDGTLLDHDTYSWAAARPALLEIKRRKVPLVFCTSKTRAEVEELRRRLGNRHPFITENGGAIFIPAGYFGPGARTIVLGRPYAELCRALLQIAARSRVRVRGFHQMSRSEVARETGLSLRRARWAREREFDEPFRFVRADEAARRRFLRGARAQGLSVTRGGRFWHLFAGSDKGLAARKLIRMYRRRSRLRIWTMGLGDGLNDLPLLSVVDLAVLLPAAGGGFDPRVLSRLPRTVRAATPGPAGWNRTVLEALRGL